MHAYIAGPLFNEGERWWNTEIDARVQRAGFTTYLPQRDGTPLKGPADVPKISEEDREAISNADLVVANLNGLCVDSGTAWELGYAHGIGTCRSKDGRWGKCEFRNGKGIGWVE